MVKNKYLKLFILGLSLVVSCLMVFERPVQASTNDKVLLVYDSQNKTQRAEKKLDALQRSLTSMNLKVKTLSQADYKSGMLDRSYLGVITMINWKEVGLTNQQFIQDRRQFNGIKLHIGQGLNQDEAAGLGGQVRKIYRQQFSLENNGNEQLLPFSESITVLDDLPAEAEKIGTLATQQTDQKSYAFGVINGKNGYLPFFRNDGLSMMTEILTIGKLFHRVGKYQPLLTFNNVTPYSNLKILDQLSRYCYKNEIPFAISTTSVSQNTDLDAFDRYTAALRDVENRGGIVFLNAPEVSSADNSGTVLDQKFSTYLVSLSRHQVFPVGVSAQGYWNQDKVFRNNLLKYASHWLMLPDQGEISHVEADDEALSTQTSYFAMKLSSLKEVKKSSTMSFAIPTSLTISLPDSQTNVQMVKQELNRSQLTWYDPIDDHLQTEIETPSTLLQYKFGNYFINGKEQDIKNNNTIVKKFDDGKPKAALTGYFKVQGNVFMIFFVIVTIVLLIFIFIGQRVYWNRFRRK